MRKDALDGRTILKLLIPFLVVCLVMILRRDAYVGSSVTQYSEQNVETQSINLQEESIIQEFTVNQDIEGMDVVIKAKADRQAEFRIQLYQADDDKLIDDQNVSVEVQPGENQVHFDVKMSGVGENTPMYFKLTQMSETDGVGVSVYEGKYQETLTNEAGEIIEGRCQFSVTHGIVFHVIFFIFTAALLYLALLILVFRMDRFFSVEKLFLAVAVSSGIMFACINPVGQECDGWEHILRAIDVSYGNVLSPVVNLTHEDGKVKVPSNIKQMDVHVIAANAGEGNLYQENLQNMHFAKDTKMMEYDKYFSSLFYLPQGLGIWLGRILNLNMYICIVLGRLLNLGCYIGLTYLAIKKLPMFKNLMTVIALLPIAMYQAASCSPDAILCGLCFLFVSLCFHYSYGEDITLGIKQALYLGILLALIYMCKYVYVCLGLLVFMIPKERFGEKKQYWKSFIAALIPLVIVMIGLSTTLIGTVGTVAAEKTGESQLNFALHNPVHVLKALISTMEQYFSIYAEWLNTLGWLEYPLGPLLYVIPCFLVGVACLDANEKSKKMKISHKVLCFIAFMLSYSAMLLGLYLGDSRINPVGASLILGGQGRYFIPLMLILAASLTSRKIENQIEAFSSKVVGCLGVFLAYAGILLTDMCY